MRTPHRYVTKQPDLLEQIQALAARVRALENGPQTSYTQIGREGLLINEDGSITVEKENGEAVVINPAGATHPEVRFYPISGSVSVPFITDNFDRSISGGWGNADSGQTWTLEGGAAAQYNVVNGVGTHDVTVIGTTVRSLIAGQADMDVTWSVSVPSIATGVAAQAGFIVREDGANNNFYIFRLLFNTDATIIPRISVRVAGVETTLATAGSVFNYAPGQKIFGRARIVGSNLLFKSWPDGSSEPSGWNLSITDNTFPNAGRFGFRSDTPSGWLGGNPYTFSYDDVVSTDTNPNYSSLYAQTWAPTGEALLVGQSSADPDNQYRCQLLIVSDQAALVVQNADLSGNAGGLMAVSPTRSVLSMVTGPTGADNGGFLIETNTYIEIGVDGGSNQTVNWYYHGDTGCTTYFGKWDNFLDWGANQGIYTGRSATGSSGDTSFALTYGSTKASTMVPLANIFDSVNHAQAISASSTSGFTLSWSTGSGAGYRLHFWVHRV